MHIIRFAAMIIWSLIWIPLATLVVGITFQRRWALKMAHLFWSPGILWIVGVKLKVVGLENINLDKPHIFVTNHQSFIDIPTMFRALPVNLHFVAKKEVKKIPFIGWFMTLTGMIFIDRDNRQSAYESMQRAGNIIKSGKNVLTFPEGTRSTDGEIGTFKKGSFAIAIDNQIPVVPVAIKNAEKIWKTGTNKFYPGTIEVIIGSAITPQQNESAIDFANKLREKVNQQRGY